MRKPIRIFYSTLTNRFFASNQYREKDGVVTITGEKFDVTNEIAAAIVEYDLEFTPVPASGQETTP